MWDKINSLKAELEDLGPLKPEDEERLWKKFRLEWNYNSNHIEGNTLTYSDTELLLIFDKVGSDYTGREIEEMKAHDVAIRFVDELSKDKNRDLNENFIRELNKIILVRPFWKDAITADGQSTKKEVNPGEYKKLPNSVRLANGEIFHYASPQETPAKMNDLIEFYRKFADDVELALKPLWLAAQLHYRFVRIHPFDDGNGRVARLLMNYYLLKNNFPPIIIKDSDKKNYITSLNKADTGNEEAFLIYLGEQLIWSLEKSINAAQGLSIEDEDDFEKELEILKKESVLKERVKVKKSRNAIKVVYENYLGSLLEKIDDKLAKIDPLFAEKDLHIWAQSPINSTIVKSPGKNLEYVYQQIFFDFYDPEKFGMIAGYGYSLNKPILPIEYPDLNDFNISYHWKAYKNAGINAFNLGIEIKIYFLDYKYQIYINGINDILLEKLYDSSITETELKNIVLKISNYTLSKIKFQVENLMKNN